MSDKVLVVGGAGYIGSHMSLCLKEAGLVPIVLDNLSTGSREAVLDCELIEGDIADKNVLDRVFSQHDFAIVMHFGSYIQVHESIQNPLMYYQNNVVGTLYLLETMLKWNVKKIIFSSSAAVYGEPLYIPIDEQHPLKPINPYGHTKRMIEQMLEDCSSAYDLRYISLRYFNASGADPHARLGERRSFESHLIPLVLQAATSSSIMLTVYGKDYPTRDGTCVRDYIHVADICSAHLLALEALMNGCSSQTYNLGNGHGFSVQEVIEVARQVTQCEIPVKEGARRFGDPASLIANPTRAMKELKWEPKYPQLRTIIQHAWKAINSFVHPL